VVIGIIFKFPKLATKLLANRWIVDREIIVAVQTNRGQLFTHGGNMNGHKGWPALTLRSGQPLMNRRTLAKSIGPNGTSGKAGEGGFVKRPGITKVGDIIVGTKLAYARMMNDGTSKMPGGVLRAKSGGVLKIPLPAGKKASDLAKKLRKTATTVYNKRTEKNERVIFRKSVKIPPRDFESVTAADAKEFRAAAKAGVQAVLRG
jgi:hypothetical protein